MLSKRKSTRRRQKRKWRSRRWSTAKSSRNSSMNSLRCYLMRRRSDLMRRWSACLWPDKSNSSQNWLRITSVEWQCLQKIEQRKTKICSSSSRRGRPSWKAWTLCKSKSFWVSSTICFQAVKLPSRGKLFQMAENRSYPRRKRKSKTGKHYTWAISIPTSQSSKEERCPSNIVCAIRDLTRSWKL